MVMIKPYRYTVEGTAAAGQTWTTQGQVATEIHDVLHVAMMESFDQLTSGKAVYGQPGKGCRGPYDIRRVTIEQVPQ